MATYKTPGVYVEEISTLPPSVAEVATAIPAFIGYTEAGKKMARISTLLEYKETFGYANASNYTVETNTVDGVSAIMSISRDESGTQYRMYHALDLYFKNGGGACYVISIGGYGDTPSRADFEEGLGLLEKEDEPTLIVLVDGLSLSPANYYGVAAAALAQCNKLGDRFCIFDTFDTESGVDDFRNGIGMNYLKYGAAYYPHLNTSLTYGFDEANVTVNFGEGEAIETKTLDELVGTPLYAAIETQLNNQFITMPPSAAVAGVYAAVDRDRGVWKAPANVSLASVIGPTQKVTHEEQENLNVDADAGKSINAIRAFTGKGTLIWGARTLAGNDNEWRYVSVRRLFNLIEESTRKSTAFAVFEPNTANTWLKVKAMIESYLFGLWQQGALAGATSEQAYFVNVGLGKTMTEQDILEGRLIVEIGIAAVRPAEFIILRFSHKLQEA